MINNINEIKDLINKYKDEYEYGIMDNILDEHYDMLKENNINWKHKETINNEEHRWFTIETNVYEFFKNNESIGFLAVDEVGMLKSESMCYEDCYVEVEAYNVKEVVKKTFEIVKEK